MQAETFKALLNEDLPEFLETPKSVSEIKAEQIAKAKASGKEYQGRVPGDKKLKK